MAFQHEVCGVILPQQVPDIAIGSFQGSVTTSGAHLNFRWKRLLKVKTITRLVLSLRSQFRRWNVPRCVRSLIHTTRTVMYNNR